MSENEPVASSPDKERRESVRYCCTLTDATTSSDEKPMAVVRNVSTGGVAIIADRPFEAGTLLSVQLQDGAQKTLRSIMVRVARVTQEQDGTWLLGCAFTSKLSDDELLNMM